MKVEVLLGVSCREGGRCGATGGGVSGDRVTGMGSGTGPPVGQEGGREREAQVQVSCKWAGFRALREVDS